MKIFFFCNIEMDNFSYREHWIIAPILIYRKKASNSFGEEKYMHMWKKIFISRSLWLKKANINEDFFLLQYRGDNFSYREHWIIVCARSLWRARKESKRHILVSMHHVFRRARIYVGHMVVGTVLGPHARTYTETRRAGFSPWLTFPRWTIPPLWESSWVFNEISGPSVRRPTPSSSSSTDKASQPAHCPYTSLWGSLLLRGVCTVRALAAQTHPSSTVAPRLKKIPCF